MKSRPPISFAARRLTQALALSLAASFAMLHPPALKAQTNAPSAQGKSNPGGASSTDLIVRNELIEPLTQAQKHITDGNVPLALSLLDNARASKELTDVERGAIEQLTISAHVKAGNVGRAVPAMEFMVQREVTPIGSRQIYAEALATHFYREKAWPQVSKWAREYIKLGGPRDNMPLMLGQSLAQQNLHGEVVAVLKPKLDADRRNGKTNSPAELRALGVSQAKLKDEAGYMQTLELLLAQEVRPEYWNDLMVRVESLPEMQKHALDLARLKTVTGQMTEAADFAVAADAALRAGLPEESGRYLDEGYKQGLLGKGGEGKQHDELKQRSQKARRDDANAQRDLEALAPSGVVLDQLGDLMLSKSEWVKADAAYAKALILGGLKREPWTRLHQGIALLNKGDKAGARKAWTDVRGDSEAMRLARLWSLVAR